MFKVKKGRCNYPVSLVVLEKAIILTGVLIVIPVHSVGYYWPTFVGHWWPPDSGLMVTKEGAVGLGIRHESLEMI